jgi:lipid-binding SYLF domain-containing protein
VIEDGEIVVALRRTRRLTRIPAGLEPEGMTTMKQAIWTAAFAALLLAPGGCNTTPTSEGKKVDLHNDAVVTADLFKRQDPSLKQWFDDAYGYAIFPSVGKGAIGVGGAYGTGELHEQGEMVGYCSLSQGTVGLQLGGQAYSQIIFFEYKEALDHFKTGNFAFSAQASAVAVSAGASSDAKYDRGVAVFTMTRGGLMFEASIGGQKFDYEPK